MYKSKNIDLESKVSDLNEKNGLIHNELKALKVKDANLADKTSELVSKVSNLTKDLKKLGPCPSNWVDGGRFGCYYVGKGSSTVTFATAKTFCKSLDQRAHLVEIRTQEIQKYVQELDLTSHGQWWIGATYQLKVRIRITQ